MAVHLDIFVPHNYYREVDTVLGGEVGGEGGSFMFTALIFTPCNVSTCVSLSPTELLSTSKL